MTAKKRECRYWMFLHYFFFQYMSLNSFRLGTRVWRSPITVYVYCEYLIIVEIPVYKQILNNYGNIRYPNAKHILYESNQLPYLLNIWVNSMDYQGLSCSVKGRSKKWTKYEGRKEVIHHTHLFPPFSSFNLSSLGHIFTLVRYPGSLSSFPRVQ